MANAHPPAPPTFKNMVITFNTSGDDKDPDTRLEIFIIKYDGDPGQAYLDIQGSGFGDPSTRQFTVPARTAFPLSELAQEEISLKIAPNGHDTWKFGFSAVLNFSDGTVAYLSVPYDSLNQDNRQHFYSLAAAHVVPSPNPEAFHIRTAAAKAKTAA